MDYVEHKEHEVTVYIGAMTGKQFTIEAMTNDTILDLKIKIFQESNVEPDCQILLYGDKALRNDYNTLKMESINDGARLQLVLEMNGGQHSHMKNNYKARFSLEEDVGMLEQLLQDLDVETAVKILNVLEGNPDILDDVLSSSESSTSNHSHFNSEKKNNSKSKPKSPPIEQIEYDECVPSIRPSSTKSSHKYIIEKTMKRLTSEREMRPISTKSVSIRTRSSSTCSMDLVMLLSKTENNIFSHSSSSKLRRMLSLTSLANMKHQEERPITTMALTKIARSEETISHNLPHLRPPTTNANTTEKKASTVSVVARTSIKLKKISSGALSASKNTMKNTSENIQELSKKKTKFPTQHINAPGLLVGSASLSERKVGSKSSLSVLKQQSFIGKQFAKKTNSIETVCVTVEKKPTIPNDSEEPNRCHACKKKVRISALFKCRCGYTFCASHRFNDKHTCSFDYKKAGKISLLKENPTMKSTKVQKI